MTSRSPLDDPEQAAYAWSRYRRLMRLLLLFTVALVAVAMLLLYDSDSEASVHFYIAIALGVGFTMLVAGGLMGLIFLSSGTGHDEAVEDRSDRPRRD